MKKKTICYIDDDKDELRRFNNAMKKYFKVITGENVTECLKKLKKAKRPNLWVLDLFLPESDVTNTPEQRAEMNRKYHFLSESVREYRAYLTSIGQGIQGGIDNLKKCKKKNVPVVFLTRKGTIDDALTCVDKGADKVLKKPMPSKWPDDPKKEMEALDDAFIEGLSNLNNHFNELISKFSHWNRHKKKYMFFIGSILGIIIGAIFEPPIKSLLDMLLKLF